MQEHNAPLVPQPEYLPEGYILEQGSVQPGFRINDNELLALKDGIKLEGGYRITWRKEPPESINYDSSTLFYTKGESRIKISAKRIKGETGTVESLLYTQNTSVENILVNGTQLIYMDHTSNGEIKLGYNYRVVWADPEQQILYDLTVSPETTLLTKEEIIRIAAGMMK